MSIEKPQPEESENDKDYSINSPYRVSSNNRAKPITFQELWDSATGIWPEGESVDDFLAEIYRARG